LEVYKLAVFIAVGIAVSYYDLRCRIIPDRLNLAGLALAVPFVKENIMWFLAAGGVMLLMAAVSNNAVGGGDVKYAAVMGMFLGFKVFPALMSACLVCGVVVLVLLAFRKIKAKDSIPFGPFLFLGGLYILIGGEILPWTIL